LAYTKVYFLPDRLLGGAMSGCVSQTYFDDDKLLKNQTRLDFTGQAVLLVREWVLDESLVFDAGIGLGGGYINLKNDVLNPNLEKNTY
jgi:hypothetical protein